MHGQDGLPVLCKHHEIGFPVPWRLPVAGFRGAFCERNSALDEGSRAAAPSAAASAFALAARQVVAPAVVLGAGDLSVDEAVDGFVADRDLFERIQAWHKTGVSSIELRKDAL